MTSPLARVARRLSWADFADVVSPPRMMAHLDGLDDDRIEWLLGVGGEATSEADAIEPPKAEPTAPKKRGRPKKVAEVAEPSPTPASPVADVGGGESLALSPPPKKRGRPKKNADPPAVSPEAHAAVFDALDALEGDAELSVEGVAAEAGVERAVAARALEVLKLNGRAFEVSYPHAGRREGFKFFRLARPAKAVADEPPTDGDPIDPANVHR